jgi:hypothetical protein
MGFHELGVCKIAFCEALQSIWESPAYLISNCDKNSLHSSVFAKESSFCMKVTGIVGRYLNNDITY